MILHIAIRSSWTWSSLSRLDKRIAGKVSDGTHVDPSLHPHVALLTPLCPPRVLDDPILGRVADHEDGVAHVFCAAFALLVYPARVVLEAGVRGVNGNRDGADGSDSFCQGILISRGDVNVALVSGADGRVAEPADGVLHADVGVAGLSVDAAILVDVLKGVVEEAAVAAVVSIGI